MILPRNSIWALIIARVGTLEVVSLVDNLVLMGCAGRSKGQARRARTPLVLRPIATHACGVVGMSSGPCNASLKCAQLRSEARSLVLSRSAPRRVRRRDTA